MTAAIPQAVPSDFEGVSVVTDVMVPMRDGVCLATDIYFPRDVPGPLSVLLERTPYGKREANHGDRTAQDPVPKIKPLIAAQFARCGYIYVIQDCRGRFDSQGVFTKYVNEGPDGVDTLAWILAQPWCNGSVGTLGLSYGAHVQSAMAALSPKGLKAMFLDSGGFSSAYHSGIRQGGAYELKQLTWALKHARQAVQAQGSTALDDVDIHAWVHRAPWRKGESPLGAAPEYEDYVVEQWANETFSDFWRRPGLYGAGFYAAISSVPAMHMTGWYDPYALTVIENYRGTNDIKPGAARMIMGPWTHGQRSVTYAGDVDFGPAATLDGNLAPDYVALRSAWFDYWLKGKALPQALQQPVLIFVMGGGSGARNAAGRLDHGGQWRAAQDWPLPGTTLTPYYMQPDGGLAVAAPSRGTRSWLHDPAKPVPTIGGAVTSGAPLMEAGAYDQREVISKLVPTIPGRALAERDDVLVFETPPLLEDTTIIGPIEAKLWVSSSAPDTDITIKLIDVHPPSADYPQGYAMNLTHGILRLRFREGFEHPVLLTPEKVYEVSVRGFPTANVFQRGHRIRVDIASSNFPHFDINPGTGVPAGERSNAITARNVLHMGPETPSYILLPLAPAED
jgi:hypothetical protein